MVLLSSPLDNDGETLTKKHENMVSELMGNKLIEEIPGVGEPAALNLKKAGFLKVSM